MTLDQPGIALATADPRAIPIPAPPAGVSISHQGAAVADQTHLAHLGSSKPAALAWLRRLLPLPQTVEHESFASIMNSALDFWDEVCRSLSAPTAVASSDIGSGRVGATEKSTQGLDAAAITAWKWLAKTHLDSLVTGQVVKGKTLVANKLGMLVITDVTVQRAHCFLEALPGLCTRQDSLGVVELLASVGLSVIDGLAGAPDAAIDSLLAMSDSFFSSEHAEEGGGEGTGGGAGRFLALFHQLLLRLVKTAYKALCASEVDRPGLTR